ncbi:MAG: nitroreductase [Chloroflexi bacterium]|nr:nitroreductase [Chloroflexota bacterium]
MPEKRHAAVRRFNRAVFNPVIKLFAGRFLYSLVYHAGRRSGREYATPVVAAIRDGSIFVPLPYGADTDWFLNVRARGECIVKMKGKRYSTTDPEIVGSSTALPVFPASLRRALARAGVYQYLRLRIG